MFKYYSTKTYVNLGSVAYRQWRADTHCNLLHGYSMTIHFEFGSDELDVRNWTVDFGGLKPLKDLLESWFDHTLLVAIDDPHYDTLISLGKLGLAKIVEVEKTGCEGIADWLYRYLNDPTDGFLRNLGYRNVWCTKIEIRETDRNSGGVQGTPDTWSQFTS